jgi:hypothetical protein
LQTPKQKKRLKRRIKRERNKPHRENAVFEPFSAIMTVFAALCLYFDLFSSTYMKRILIEFAMNSSAIPTFNVLSIQLQEL